MELTNKTLALLIVGTVIVSLGGNLMSLNKLEQIQELKEQMPEVVQKGLTGYASTGRVDLTIITNMSCDVNNNITFGSSGQVPSETTLTTDSANSGTFNSCLDGAGTNDCKGLEINNTGNVHINVSFNSSVNGSTLLRGQAGAANADFNYWIRNGTYSATRPGCVVTPNPSGEVPTTTTGICSNLTANLSANTITIEFNVTIRPDLPSGEKEATILVGCAQA